MKTSVIGITLLSALTFASVSSGDTYQRSGRNDGTGGDAYTQRVRYDDRRDTRRQRVRHDDRRRETRRRHARNDDRRKDRSPFIVQFFWGSPPPVERRVVYSRSLPYGPRFIRHRHFSRWSPPYGKPFYRDRYAPPYWRHRPEPRPWWGW